MKIDYLHAWIHNILCIIMLVACCAVEVFKNLFECYRGKLVGVRHGKAGRKNTKFNPRVLASDALSCLNFFESLRVSESKVLAD